MLRPHKPHNLAVLVLFLLCLGASPVFSKTLEDTLLYAYENSPQLMAAQARRKGVATKVAQARADFLPAIEGRADYARSSINSQGFFNQDEDQKPRTGEIVVKQPIFDGFSSIAQFKQAQYLRDAADEEHERQKQQVLFDAANAFFGILRDKDILNISRRSESFFIEQLESARDRFEVGEVTFTDVAQAEARLAQAKAETTRSAGNYTISQARYYDIVGIDPPLDPETPKFKFRLPKTLESALAQARKNHPMLKSAFTTTMPPNKPSTSPSEVSCPPLNSKDEADAPSIPSDKAHAANPYKLKPSSQCRCGAAGSPTTDCKKYEKQPMRKNTPSCNCGAPSTKTPKSHGKTSKQPKPKSRPTKHRSKPTESPSKACEKNPTSATELSSMFSMPKTNCSYPLKDSSKPNKTTAPPSFNCSTTWAR